MISHLKIKLDLSLHLGRLIFALALLSVMSAPFGSAAEASGFFDGPVVGAPEPMFFSIYSIRALQNGQANVQKIANGHFTTSGPHYIAEADPLNNPSGYFDRVNEAASVGLDYIAHITNHPGVIDNTSGFIRDNSMQAISEASLRQHVRDVMDVTLNDTTANATVSAWYTLPEELRHFRTQEMNYLNIIADEVSIHDPLNRPISMYNPNNRLSSDLVTIVNQGLDWTMMGVYVTDVSFDTRAARMAQGVGEIVSAASTTGTKPVTALQLSENFDSTDILGLRNDLGGVSTTAAIQHVIRHDTYQAILQGSKGIQIWSGCDCRSGLTTFSAQLDGYTSVSTDLNGSLGLSQVFLSGEEKSDFTAQILTGPTTVTHTDTAGTTVIDTITIGDYALGDDRYLFLANSANEDVSLRVSGLPMAFANANLLDLFQNAGAITVEPTTGEFLIDLEPLAIVALKIESPTVLQGDYNADGLVDAADYTVWRDTLGSSSDLRANGDDSGTSAGVIDNADYVIWNNSYGASSNSSSKAKAIPEPSQLTMISIAIFTILTAKIRLV